MAKKCNQLYTPEVDNTLSKCDDFLDFECVLTEDTCDAIGEYKNLKEFAYRVCVEIGELKIQIEEMQERITILENGDINEITK